MRSRSVAIAAIAGLGAMNISTSHATGAHAEHALGKVDFTISCSEQAQTRFTHAIALLHHMTYPQARDGFEKIATGEPQCAMAHWGVAMTLFQPLWPTRPSPDELRRGLEATQKAKALQPRTARERLLIESAAAFFEGAPSLPYWQRIQSWERAMAQAHSALPQDPEVAAFYALAHLATAPADKVSLAHPERAAELLLAVYERNPDHPGAMHYLIHANDVPGRENQFLEIVRRYKTVAPRNPHALHMPTHIYTRLGEWESVIDGNRQAAEAALEHSAGDRGQFVWDEFPHAIEYLIYAHLQQGADDKAGAQLRRLQQTSALEPSFKTAFHLASTQARFALERRNWAEAHALQPRTPTTLDWDRYAWPEAVTWFARGLGAAHEKQLDEARDAVKRLEVLEANAEKAGEVLFMRHIRVLRLGVSACLAQTEGQSDSSVQLMREAAELEASTPKHAVTPAPTLPAHELLGDLLLEQGRAAQALDAYERSLELYPRRFNSVLGAARAARAAGDASRAHRHYSDLITLAKGSTRESALAEARKFARASQ